MTSLGLSRGVRRVVTLGVVLVVLAPVLAWTVLFPPLVDITVGKRTVDYEFKRDDYAREFARLNDGKVA